MTQPSIETERLVLRPFRLEDAIDVQTLAGHELVAKTTANIPHPYPDGAAENWIASHQSNWERSTQATFAITLRNTSGLLGAIGLMDIDGESAELGYWIGVPYWGHGYCSEAAAAVCEFASSALELERLRAQHLESNPASGAVLKNCGFEPVGAELIPDWKGGVTARVLNYERHGFR